MDKLKLAHDYALVRITCSNPKTLDEIISLSWYYADAMQAEADKRNKAEAAQKRKEIREMLNAPNTFVEREGQHFDDVADVCKTYSSSEWQPDWSQAPDDMVRYFAVDEDGRGGWYINKPDLCFDHWYWSGLGERVVSYEDADNFGYQGNWKESLRKRPQ